MLKPMTFSNQELMNDLNDMMIRIKRHLFGIPGDTIKPENEELDKLTNRIMEVLKKDTEPTIKYNYED
jgi:ribonuclease HI